MEATKFQKAIGQNPEVFAQMQILEAAFEIEAVYRELVEILIEKNLVGKATVEVRPYNSGYEVNVDIRFNYLDWNLLRDNPLIPVLHSVGTVYLYPGSWFNEYFRTSPQGGSLEGCKMKTSSQDFNSANVRVTTMDAISMAVEDWRKSAIERLNEVKEMVINNQ